MMDTVEGKHEKTQRRKLLSYLERPYQGKSKVSKYFEFSYICLCHKYDNRSNHEIQIKFKKLKQKLPFSIQGTRKKASHKGEWC